MALPVQVVQELLVRVGLEPRAEHHDVESLVVRGPGRLVRGAEGAQRGEHGGPGQGEVVGGGGIVGAGGAEGGEGFGEEEGGGGEGSEIEGVGGEVVGGGNEMGGEGVGRVKRGDGELRGGEGGEAEGVEVGGEGVGREDELRRVPGGGAICGRGSGLVDGGF